MHHLLTASDPRLETPFTFHERPLRQLNPAISPELDAVVSKALEYDVGARWNSAEEMKQALLGLVSFGAPMTGMPNKPAAPAARGGRAAATELLWSFKCDDEIRSSACVANGMVYVGCYDTNLYALDSERGEFRWKYPS